MVEYGFSPNGRSAPSGPPLKMATRDCQAPGIGFECRAELYRLMRQVADS